MPSNPWIPVAREIATEVGVPFPLFAALIDSESGWDPEARSPVGAYGLGQLMPGTARGLGVDPNDPRQNLTGAARYLKTQLEAFKDIRLALAAYNAGPGAVRKYGGIPPYRETQNYVETVLGRRSRYKPTAPGAVPAPQAPTAPAAPQTRTSVPDTGPLLAMSMLKSRSQGFDPLRMLQELVMVKQQQATMTPRVGDAPDVAIPGITTDPTAELPFQKFGAMKPIRGLAPILQAPMSGSSEYAMPDAEGAPAANGNRYHAAKDWFGAGGSAVYSPITGKVVEVKASRGRSGQVFGGVVKIQAPNGMVFVMRHVDPLKLKMGQRIKAGVPIARVTDWTDGSPHVHLEVWKSLSGGYRFENMLDPGKVFARFSEQKRK